MLNRKTLSLLTIAMIFAGAKISFADESPAEQIKRLNEESAVLSAKLEKADQEAKLAQKQLDIEKLRQQSGTGANTTSSDLPVIRQIEGANGQNQAVLATGGGILKTVRTGDKVGEYTVSKITVNSVELRSRDKKVLLGFGLEPSGATQSNTGVLPNGLPR